MTRTGAELPRRVLAIGAHPDDIELPCAGTLARSLAAGADVQLAVACRGDRGGSDGPDPDLAVRRRDRGPPPPATIITEAAGRRAHLRPPGVRL